MRHLNWLQSLIYALLFACVTSCGYHRTNSNFKTAIQSVHLIKPKAIVEYSITNELKRALAQQHIDVTPRQQAQLLITIVNEDIAFKTITVNSALFQNDVKVTKQVHYFIQDLAQKTKKEHKIHASGVLQNDPFNPGVRQAQHEQLLGRLNRKLSQRLTQTIAKTPAPDSP